MVVWSINVLKIFSKNENTLLNHKNNTHIHKKFIIFSTLLFLLPEV